MTRPVPNDEECIELLHRHGVPENIIAHSRMVSRCAYALAKAIGKRGTMVDAELARAGGWLHDIAKLENKDGKLVPRKNHAEAAGELLRKEGLDRVASVAEVHDIGAGEFGRLKTIEDKIVCYCDKRAEHDTVVSIDERLDALRVRYASFPGVNERLERLWPELKRLEKEVCMLAGIEPQELARMAAK